MRRGIIKKLRRWFLSGIAVILPVGVTVFVLLKLFQLLDGIFAKIIIWVFGREIPGIGLLLIILLVLIIGILASNLFGKRLIGWFQKIITKVPIVKTVYKPVNKIVSAISDDKTKSFQKVVAVEFPMKGTQSIGFITNDRISIDNVGKLCVFIPTTPNPTNGFLVIMDEKDVIELDISVSEGLNAVVSIGSAVHGNLNTLKTKVSKK